MTEKDKIIQDQRREIQKLKDEITLLEQENDRIFHQLMSERESRKYEIHS